MALSEVAGRRVEEEGKETVLVGGDVVMDISGSGGGGMVSDMRGGG